MVLFLRINMTNQIYPLSTATIGMKGAILPVPVLIAPSPDASMMSPEGNSTS